MSIEMLKNIQQEELRLAHKISIELIRDCDEEIKKELNKVFKALVEKVAKNCVSTII